MSIDPRSVKMKGKIPEPGIVERMFVCGLLVFFLIMTAACPAVAAQEKTAATAKPKISVGVLVDTGQHQRKVIELEREAVNSIAEIFAGEAAEGFILTYGDKVDVLEDWTPLGPKLKQVATRIDLHTESSKSPRTLLNDALQAALQRLDARQGIDLKVLIVVGEGNDWGSSARAAEIKKLAQSARVQCFALLVADHELIGGRVRHFGFDLDALTWSTRGNGYDVGNSRKRLDKALKDVRKRVRRQLQVRSRSPRLTLFLRLWQQTTGQDIWLDALGKPARDSAGNPCVENRSGPPENWRPARSDGAPLTEPPDYSGSLGSLNNTVSLMLP